MYFNLEENECLSLKTDNGVVVIINLQTNEITLDGSSLDGSSDTMHGLYVLVNGAWVSLYAVLIKAASDYNSIISEHDQARIDECAMREEHSSPYYTGRI